MTKTTRARTRARYTLEFKQEAGRLIEGGREHCSGGANLGSDRSDAVQLGQGAPAGQAPVLTASPR